MPQEEGQEVSASKQQETLVTYDVDGQPKKVDLKDVNRLFADIHKYNDQFSLGSMVARIVLFRFEQANDEVHDTPTIGEEEENQQIDSFFLASAHKNTLESIGLSLEPVTGKVGRIMGEEGTAGEGQMRVNVGRHENFTSFLCALNPQQIETIGTKHHLEGLSSTLAQQVLDSYDLQAPGEEAIQLFSGLEKIVAEYKRLGMEEATGRLEAYLEHGKKGDLREYVAVERRELLYEPNTGHFGPGDWQRDSSPSMLRARWNEAIKILQMAKENPNAQELYNQLRGNLVIGIQAAISNEKEIGPKRSPEFVSHEEIMQVLESSKQKLEEISVPEGKDTSIES